MSRAARTAITFAILLAIVVAVAVPYGVLLNEGKVSAPDLSEVMALLDRLSTGLTGTARELLVLSLAIVVFIAAIAPILYAARSGDALTVVVSIVLVVATWVMAFQSRTVIDLALAAVVYLASMVSSVIVFAATRITDAIGRTRG